MGISAKWLKSFVGLKKQEKSQNLEDDVNVSETNKFFHVRMIQINLFVSLLSSK